MPVKQILSEVHPFLDSAGNPVVFDDCCWYVHTVRTRRAQKFDFAFLKNCDEYVQRAVVSYTRHRIVRNSEAHAHNSFKALKKFILRSDHLRDDFIDLFRQSRNELRREGLEYTAHYIRDWWLFCSDQYLEGFDDAETRLLLKEMEIPGNPKGVAVLSEDPDEGPLHRAEEVALLGRLQQTTILTTLELVLVWLFYLLGPNPSNLSQLKEQDHHKLLTGSSVFYLLDVPRIKKRLPPRSDFKPRKLESQIGALIDALIVENAARYPHPATDRPLFWSTEPRPGPVEWETFRWHLSSRDLSQIFTRAIDKLGVISPATGERLRVTPRRARYSLAARAVESGAEEPELADLLDHSDIQHVLVYFRNREQREKINKSSLPVYGPLAKRFMGEIARNEADAGGSAKNRVVVDLVGRNIVGLGTCKLDIPCDKFPPRSCYGCRKFLAWRDAPHDEFLETLIVLGDADPRGTMRLDDTILAVAELVEKCKA